MNGFSPDWLALREPYDLAARNGQVLDTVANAFLGQAAISVVDLACGAGATLRAVGPHLPPRQSWRLVDNSLSLLARAFAPEHPPYVNVTTTPLDLARPGTPPRWSTRSRHHVGAARPCFARMARSPRCRSRGATAAVLCGADLRRPRRRRTAAALRRRAPGGLQPPPAHRQGLRASARAERGGAGRRAVPAFRIRAGARPLGLGIRTRRSGHSGRPLCRLGGVGAVDHGLVGRRDRGMACAASRPSGRRPFELAHWSRRHFCPADRHPLSAEIAVE